MTEKLRNDLESHTPGPWKNDSMLFSAGWRCIVNAGNRSFDIADPCDRITDAVDVANARLIAAAPDLLEALKKVATITADWGWRERIESCDLNDIAKTAIAKAQCQ